MCTFVYRMSSRSCGPAANGMRDDVRRFAAYLSVYAALFWRPGSPRQLLYMNVCKSLLRVATQKNPNRIPEWEQRLRRSRTPDEGDHRGFPSYLSVYPALFWRPGSPRPRLCMNVCKSLLRVATQKNPNRIPEWEQRLRRSRTRDEGKPSGFSLIYQYVRLITSRSMRITARETLSSRGDFAWRSANSSWRSSEYRAFIALTASPMSTLAGSGILSSASPDDQR